MSCYIVQACRTGRQPTRTDTCRTDRAAGQKQTRQDAAGQWTKQRKRKRQQHNHAKEDVADSRRRTRQNKGSHCRLQSSTPERRPATTTQAKRTRSSQNTRCRRSSRRQVRRSGERRRHGSGATRLPGRTLTEGTGTDQPGGGERRAEARQITPQGRRRRERAQNAAGQSSAAGCSASTHGKRKEEGKGQGGQGAAS